MRAYVFFTFEGPLHEAFRVGDQWVVLGSDETSLRIVNSEEVAGYIDPEEVATIAFDMISTEEADDLASVVLTPADILFLREIGNALDDVT